MKRAARDRRQQDGRAEPAQNPTHERVTIARAWRVLCSKTGDG
jgi:hypothetical protein